MENKVIVITGTSSGMGKSLKEKLSVKNIVISLDIKKLDEPNSIECDVSDYNSVEHAFNIIAQKYDHIDLLINNAGFGLSGATELLPVEEVRRLFNVNYFGVLNVTQCALRYMHTSGKIINISSACAIFPLPYRSMYCASKSAVNMLSYGLRMELKSSGIEVCSICPGDTKTNFTKNRVKISSSNSRYQQSVIQSAEKVDKNQDKRMSVDYVTNKIIKIANKKHLPAIKIIGFKYKVFNVLYRLTPTNIFLKAINKIFNVK